MRHNLMMVKSAFHGWNKSLVTTVDKFMTNLGCDLKSFPQCFFGEAGGRCSSCFSQLESTLCVVVFDHQYVQVEPLLGFDQREHSHQPFYLHSNNHRDVRIEDDVRHGLRPGLRRTKHAVDVNLIVPRHRNNRDAHLDYLRHLKDSMETIRDIVEEAKVVKPLDRSIISACQYAIGTCPHGSQPRAKQLIPLIKKKQVIVAQPSNKLDSITHPHVVTVTSQKTDVPVPPSLGVDSCPIAGGSKPMSHVKPNRIAPAKGDTKLQIDDQPRKNKSHLRTSTRTNSRSRLKRTVINSHSSHYNRSVERKVKQVWKPKHVRQVWKPTGKVLTTIGYQWRPTGWIFDLGNQQPAFQFEECPSPKRQLSLTTGNFSNPGMDYLISVHTRSNVRLSALFPDTEEKSSVPPHNFTSMILQENYVELTYLLKGDKMADVNAPSDQTPTMAPPVRADDQILPHIRWIPIGKSNCYLDLEKSQSNPIYNIAVDLLKNTNFFRAFTASSNLPSIYIQQFWDTIRHDKKAGAEEVPTEEPQIADEDADFQKAMEEEVPGKGKAKVSEEQVAYDLLSLQKHKKTSPTDQYIFQRRVYEPTASSFHDVSPYEVLGQSDSEDESKKIMHGVEKGGQDEGQAGPNPNAQAKGQTGSDTDAQADGQARSNPDETSEGQAGSNPDETSEGQAGPDLGNAEARVQSTLSPVVHTGSDREHMDIDVANLSPQPSTEQLYEGFTATVYPNVQENLKLAVEELVLLEEPASSSETLSSLQHLSRDFTFGDQFFSDKPSDADKSAETKVKSMVNVPIQQALSSISLMTSPIIDLTSRPESPKEHQQLKATITDTTTITTTMLPPPQAPQ
nr:hypothetical protein [Tanacetum cinerariifolium]